MDNLMLTVRLHLPNAVVLPAESVCCKQRPVLAHFDCRKINSPEWYIHFHSRESPGLSVD